MTNARYSVWYCDDLGRHVAPLPYVGELEYVRTFSGVGFARISIPPDDPIAASVRPDWRLHIYRQPAGGAMALEVVCFLRRFVWSTDAQGRRRLQLQGVDPNDILNRRVVAFYAGDIRSASNGPADDAMKEVVERTLGFGAQFDYDSVARSEWARDIREFDGRTVFSIQGKTGDGPKIEKQYAWKNALRTLQEMQATARARGDEVFFGIVPLQPGLLQFQTWVGQPGLDRSVTTGTSPVVFSVEAGTLANPELSYDYTDERNFIYAGGRGIEDDRNIQEADDEARIGLSHFGRNEAFAQASRYDSDDGVQGAAEDELARRRPAVILTGDLLDTPLTPYGGPAGWNLGDKVSLSYEGFQMDTLIRSVHVRVSPQGQEAVRGRVEADAGLVAG